jgi:hypothetical protein
MRFSVFSSVAFVSTRKPILMLASLGLLVSGAAHGQAMSDFAAASAGAAIGAAGGKAASNGITAIFNKVNGAADKAAKADQPALVVGPSQQKDAPAAAPGGSTAGAASMAAMGGSASAPSGSSQNGANRGATQSISLASMLQQSQSAAAPAPQMTADALRTVTTGMEREDVLKLGTPAYRITMFEGGHLVETYAYRNNGEKFGSVRLTDGSVAAVQIANLP